MHTTSSQHMLPSANEGRDFPRKMDRGSLLSQDLGPLPGERPAFGGQGDLSCSFTFLPASWDHRSGDRMWVTGYQNQSLSYGIPTALATPKCLLITVGVSTCP